MDTRLDGHDEKFTELAKRIEALETGGCRSSSGSSNKYTSCDNSMLRVTLKYGDPDVLASEVRKAAERVCRAAGITNATVKLSGKTSGRFWSLRLHQDGGVRAQLADRFLDYLELPEGGYREFRCPAAPNTAAGATPGAVAAPGAPAASSGAAVAETTLVFRRFQSLNDTAMVRAKASLRSITDEDDTLPRVFARRDDTVVVKLDIDGKSATRVAGELAVENGYVKLRWNKARLAEWNLQEQFDTIGKLWLERNDTAISKGWGEWLE